MKKVPFRGKPSTASVANADSWVRNREVEPKEVMKRLTIDVSLSLHKRIKSSCALRDAVMADEIRDLLDQWFPASVGPGVPT